MQTEKEVSTMLDKVLKFAEKRAAEIFVFVVIAILIYAFFGTIWAIEYTISSVPNIFLAILDLVPPVCICIADMIILYIVVRHSDEFIEKMKEDLS
jgi:hypothetical protein